MDGERQGGGVKNIKGRAHLLGDNINTDLNCSSKYLPGKDNAYIAQHVFEQVGPPYPRSQRHTPVPLRPP